MGLPVGSRFKDHKKIRLCHNDTIGFDSKTLLVLRFPHSRVLRVLSRSLFLAIVLITLPWIGPILREFSSDSHSDLSSYRIGSDSINAEFLDLLLRDLANDALIKKGDKAIIVTSGIGAVIGDSHSLNSDGVNWVLESDLAEESLFPCETFDFAFCFGIQDTKSIDRIVKVGGIVVAPVDEFLSPVKHPNYQIVYLRRYGSTIVGMRKMSMSDQHLHVDSSIKRRLFQVEVEAKKAALEGLEDVLLEPPRKILTKSRQFFRKFNYLPDLLGDSLEGYERRIFVDVGSQQESGAMAWFKQNYPTRNQEFELYNIGTELGRISQRVSPPVDASIWLIKNVREDDFVVMKAEATVVEEMIQRNSIGLVDELFLECDNQWQKKERKKMNRAYWECLSLYGRLRDEGVAVHQWWG